MRVLVTGVGRSGTTWVATTLATAPGADVLREPDTIESSAFAMRAHEGLGINPVVGVDEPGPADLVRLWDAAFGGAVRYVRGQQRIAAFCFDRTTTLQRKETCHPVHPRFTPGLRVARALAVPWRGTGERHQVVKSIRLPFALEWVSARWQPEVVLCRRHPLDVVASQLELGHESELQWLAPAARRLAPERYGVAEPETDDPVTCLAWRIGLSMSALDEARRRHPEFHVVDHEVLCSDPLAQFRQLFTAVGIEWTTEVAARIEASNRPGTGYETNRIARDQSGKWRERLSPHDARVAAGVVAQFPIAQYYDLDVEGRLRP
jgi:hypothetical protein